MSTRLVLSSSAKKKLELQCANRLNWSDGGRWIGYGQAPDCFKKEVVRCQKTQVFNFPTDESATRWNLDWERVIRHGGHIGTVAMSLALGFITSEAIGLAAGMIAGMAKDE